MGSARWRLAVLLVLVVVAASVGCGKANDAEQVATESDPLDLLADSAQDTLGEDTFRFEMFFEMEGEIPNPFPDDPCYAPAADEWFPEGPILAGVFDTTTEFTTVEVVVDDDGDDSFVLLAGPDAMYYEGAVLPAEWGVDTEWVAVAIPESLPFGIWGIPGQGEGGAALDPATLLETLRGAATSVEVVGREDVRGEPTTVHRVTLDAERYEAEQLELQREWDEVYAEEESELGDDYSSEIIELGIPVPVIEVAVDDAGLVRRIDSWIPEGEYELPVETVDPSLPEGVTIPEMPAMTWPEFHSIVEFFDFGQAPPVEPPPADQVTDAEELGRSLLEIDEATYESSGEDEAWEEEPYEPLPGCEEEFLELDLEEGTGEPIEMLPDDVPEDWPGGPIDDAIMECLTPELLDPDTTFPEDETEAYVPFSQDPALAGCLPPDVLQAVQCMDSEVVERGVVAPPLLPPEAFDEGSAMMTCIPEHLRAAARCSLFGGGAVLLTDPTTCE